MSQSSPAGEADVEDDIQWDEVSLIISSRYRKHVVEELQDAPKIPSEMANEANPMASISHSLSQLRNRGIVELLVDEDVRKGRIYGLTERGETIADQVEEVA